MAEEQAWDDLPVSHRDLKRQEKRGKSFDKLHSVIETLPHSSPLDVQYRDHPLGGELEFFASFVSLCFRKRPTPSTCYSAELTCSSVSALVPPPYCTGSWAQDRWRGSTNGAGSISSTEYQGLSCPVQINLEQKDTKATKCKSPA